ncbi:chromobox protein homolog 1 [Linepithema humile]|uniref:chromobox protein homolog 1 n=1 Tax=Linepithema humile TaxID=83485 RepID=UPI000622FE4C|nr:PREDICTED: chromobox protein homolog 1-like [Linepithema humile]
MRRLSMKNKHRKSETASDSESEKNGGARIATDSDENDDALVTRKSASKRRSSRGASAQKPATENAEADDGNKDDSAAEKEQTNGEKTAGQKLSNKRRKKEDQKASTSARDKSPDNEYEVEELINLRTIKGRRQFLVRWKGYGESADTWENEKDLSCPELIQEYLAKEREKDIKSSKTGSVKADRSRKSKGNSKIKTENEENIKEKEKEGSKEFEVEKIVEVRFKKNGSREFLIRWKGFGPVDDTWEPEKNLNCPDLISKFMQKVERAKISDMRELRTNRVHTKRYTLSTQDSGRRLSKRNKDKQRATYHECD